MALTRAKIPSELIWEFQFTNIFTSLTGCTVAFRPRIVSVFWEAVSASGMERCFSGAMRPESGSRVLEEKDVVVAVRSPCRLCTAIRAGSVDTRAQGPGPVQAHTEDLARG